MTLQQMEYIVALDKYPHFVLARRWHLEIHLAAAHVGGRD